MSIFNQNIFEDIILSIKEKFDIAGEDNFTDFIRSYKKEIVRVEFKIAESRNLKSSERNELVEKNDNDKKVS